ncbi:hypothetical protein HGRIS_007151 [Hohenbuehelia grisea]|uniref:Uncharacterized protein n=1 Tax=Hohenbuehelia grisea TaxID=104357 RepID=A0ABR3JB70_9AGAR
MDSTLNLNTLASSLPSTYQNAEKEVMADFKAAALSITNLYRSSRNASKRAYNAGYIAACQDVLTMIQQGVSDIGPATGDSQDGQGNGMTIGRVMDWIEARRDAIKAREEEEDEDEENQKQKDRQHQRASVVPEGKVTKADPPHTDAPQVALASESTSSHPQASSSSPAPELSSPSPPPPTTLRSILPPQGIQRPLKRTKDAMDASTFSFPSSDARPSSAPPTFVDAFPDPIPIAAGAKRRHAMMMMLDSSSSPVPITPTSPNTFSPFSPVANSSPLAAGAHPHGSAASARRRTRSSRMTPQQNQNVALLPNSEAMDVEEEGRERKRVARR